MKHALCTLPLLALAALPALAAAPGSASDKLDASILPARWQLFRAPAKPGSWGNLTQIPQNLDNAAAESLEVKDGLISVPQNDQNPRGSAFLYLEFDSPQQGMILLSCNAAGPFQVIFNQLPATRLQLKSAPQLPHPANKITTPAGPLSPYANQVLLHVRQGRNLLALKLDAQAQTPGYHFAYAPAPNWKHWQHLLPSREHLEPAAQAKLPEHHSQPRRLAERRIHEAVSALHSDIFKDFDQKPELAPAERDEFHRRWPILWLYDQALDRLLSEIPQTTPPPNGVILWYLYNMGYVIKTPTVTIGIDIHHRRAHLLEPLLDALLITHNHADHYNQRLIDAMLAKGKRVFSNFVPSPDCSDQPRDFTLGNVLIQTEITDHNPTLRRFMTTYRLICGDEAQGAPVIYHTGDSFNHLQLQPRGRVDVFIVHPRVGLSVPNAAAAFNPKTIYFSHLYEMGHCKPGRYYPITFGDAHNDIRAMARRKLTSASLLPFWGESFTLTP